ncbi:MAG: hypothetical protein SFU27_00905 [Thermonemataceae bacterium]|nr:hypothetical protein [Thermonemataceae bacterium]
MKKLVFIIFFTPFLSFAQTIKGKIENNKGEKILLANIIIKDSLNSEVIKEFVIARNGEYSITLQNEYKMFIVEVTAYGYTKAYFELGNLEKTGIYTRDFLLVPDDEQIEEVVIKAKNSFTIKDDTTKFNVSAYSDGTERKIEEIIKKLPGVQVNEKTGEIKYKNKSIETIKLDGDDLFGSNYSIGSRNINVGMVEQIQAIENYSDNPLLKGIEYSDKIILNLKLKKGVDVSGDIDLGNGVMAGKRFARDVGSTLLAVTKKYKAFANVSFNNIGINRTPFDYFATTSYNPEQLKERNFFAQKIIPESGFAVSLDNQRININQTLFSSYNQTFKIRKKVTIKNNFYFIRDRIASTQSTINDIRINNDFFRTVDNNFVEKKPLLYRADTDIKINSSSSSLLEFNFKIRQENIFTPTKVIQNEVKNIYTELDTKDFYAKHKIIFTKKISSSTALQILLEQADNKISQNYLLSPSLSDSISYDKDRQFVQSDKSFIEAKTVLLANTQKSKYVVSFGTSIENNFLLTRFEGIKNDIKFPLFANDITYKKIGIFQEANYMVRLNKWKFISAYRLNYLSQDLKNETKPSKIRNLIFEPSLTINRGLSDVAFLSLYYNYQQQPFSVEYFYTNPIFTSARMLQKNEVNLTFQNTHLWGTSYNHNDLYNQFLLNAGLEYSLIKGNYFSDLTIQANRTQMIYFYLPQNTSSTRAYVISEKYLHSIFLLIKYNASYMHQTYTNIVNGSDLRKNKSDIFTMNMEAKTAFNTKINLQSELHYGLFSSKNSTDAFVKNENTSYKLSLIYKPNKWSFAVLSADYFLPNLKKKEEKYYFIDFHYLLKLENKPYQFNFWFKNILNQDTFEQVQTSDYATITYRNNLIPRYFLLSVAVNL